VSNDEWNVVKTAEQRERIRRRKATRNSVKNKPIRKQRFGNSFTAISNEMGEDIPTSGQGWTLNSA
jgi:hypothetical protein